MCHRFTHKAGRLLWLCIASSCILFFTSCASTTASVAPTPTSGSAPTPTQAGAVISTAITTYSGHSGAVLGLSWSPDGTRIASCGDDGTIQVWNARTGKSIWNVHIGKYAFAVAWSPDATLIASSSNDGAIQVWKPTLQELVD